MIRNYFAHRNYSLIYGHLVLDRFSKAIIEVFTAGIFVSLGMPIWAVLLFFGCEFGLRGILSPLGSWCATRMPLAVAILLALIFKAIFFFMITMTEQSLLVGFLGFIPYAVFGGIYFPCYHTIHSIYIDDKHRGKQMTLSVVFITLSALLATFSGGLLLNAGMLDLALIIAICMATLGTVPLFFLPSRHMDQGTVPLLAPFDKLISQEFRPHILPFFGHGLVIIGNYILPFFVFLSLGDFRATGITLAAAIAIQLIATLAAGQAVDRKSSGFQHGTTVFHILTQLGLIFFSKGMTGILFTQSAASISFNFFRTIMDTAIHRLAARQSSSILFSATKELTLCLGELVSLSFFALLAFFIGEMVFPVIFLSAAIGILLAWRFSDLRSNNA